jgi:hypothetical protein
MNNQNKITEIPEVDLLEDFYSEKPLSEEEMQEVSKELEKG